MDASAHLPLSLIGWWLAPKPSRFRMLDRNPPPALLPFAVVELGGEAALMAARVDPLPASPVPSNKGVRGPVETAGPNGNNNNNNKHSVNNNNKSNTQQ